MKNQQIKHTIDLDLAENQQHYISRGSDPGTRNINIDIELEQQTLKIKKLKEQEINDIIKCSKELSFQRVGLKCDIRKQISNRPGSERQQKRKTIDLEIEGLSPTNLKMDQKRQGYRKKSYEQKRILQQTIQQFMEMVSEEETEREQMQLRNRIYAVRVMNQYKELGIYESARFLVRLFLTEFQGLMISMLLIIMMLLIQLNLELDQKCDLEKLKKRGNNRDLNSECPLGHYLVINIRNIIIKYWIYIYISIILTNSYQLKRRKLMHLFFMLVLSVYIAIECVYQSIAGYSVFNEYIFVLWIVFFGLNYFCRHNVGILVYRVIQVMFYTFMIKMVFLLNVYQRDNKSIYSGIFVQYFTILVKKLLKICLYHRLQDELYYDDISVYYMMVVLTEYIFVFEYLLVQPRSAFQKLVVVVNFAIIQTENITNMSLFVQFYEYLKRKNYYFFKVFSVFQYFMLIGVSVYHFFTIFVEYLYIWIGMSLFVRISQKFFKKDNQIGQSRHIEAARSNGYFVQKIEQAEIKNFMSQQSLISFFYFLVYLVILLINNTGPFNSTDKQVNKYRIIHKIDDLESYDINNIEILVFILTTTLFMLGLLVKKGHQYLKIVKQPTKYQIYLIQIITSVGIICMVDKRLFENVDMKQMIEA